MAPYTAAFNGFLWNEICPTNELTDPRMKPRIRLETIVGSVMLLPLAGARSFLNIDLLLRGDAGRYFDESVSDTHLIRVIRELSMDELRKINRRVFEKDPSTYRLESGRELRVGLVDGTSLNKQLMSAFQAVRNDANRTLVDFEPSHGTGHELKTSATLIERNVQKGSSYQWDLIGADGLYMTRHHFNQCLNFGVDFFVKSKEEGLTIFQEARALFQRRHLYPKDIEFIEGVEEKRGISYQAFASSGFSFEGVERLLRVAMITETSIATGETEIFFIVTSRDDLTALELRELGHLRWSIENNGFKLFNSLSSSKHGYVKDEAASLRLVFILAIGFNSLLLFLHEKWNEIEKHWRKAKMTLRHLARHLLDQLLRSSRMIKAQV